MALQPANVIIQTKINSCWKKGTGEQKSIARSDLPQNFGWAGVFGLCNLAKVDMCSRAEPEAVSNSPRSDVPAHFFSSSLILSRWCSLFSPLCQKSWRRSLLQARTNFKFFSNTLCTQLVSSGFMSRTKLPLHDRATLNTDSQSRRKLSCPRCAWGRRNFGRTWKWKQCWDSTFSTLGERKCRKRNLVLNSVYLFLTASIVSIAKAVLGGIVMAVGD